MDPLEQFDVLTLSIPLLGGCGITNLSLLHAFCIVVMGLAFASFSPQMYGTYDFGLKAIYQLVAAIVKENLYVGKQQYFVPLLYLFFTIFFANIAGMLPYSFTITSAFVVTLFLAMTHYVAFNLLGAVQHRWVFFQMLLPAGAPLVIAPFIIFIEAVSYIARVFSLSIRLFANMMSGHALLKILIGFSWALLVSGSVLSILAVAPWMIVTAIMFLELLIAFLQAYVFTILVTLYINDVLNLH